MRRIIVDYAKLTGDILNLLVEKFPEGYDDTDIIRSSAVYATVEMFSVAISNPTLSTDSRLGFLGETTYPKDYHALRPTPNFMLTDS